MVTRIVILLLLILSTSGAFAQFNVGFTFSPVLSTNRVDYDRDTIDFTSNDTGLRFSLGPIVDIQLRDNYYFNTGILFFSKRVGLTTQVDGEKVEEVYNLQYISVPATLKLFTNEIALDTKVYFQFGGSFDFLISQKPKEEEFFIINDFTLVDIPLLFGIGAEYRVGVNTWLFAGFSYSRGLINTVDETIPLQSGLNVKNDLLSLNLGIKF